MGTVCFGLFLRLGNTAYGNVNFRDFIPCSEVCDAGWREVENLLEYLHAVLGFGTVDPICSKGRNGRVIATNPVKLGLELTHFFAGGTDAEFVSGIGRRNTGDHSGSVDEQVISKIIPEDFNSGISLIGQIL